MMYGLQLKRRSPFLKSHLRTHGYILNLEAMVEPATLVMATGSRDVCVGGKLLVCVERKLQHIVRNRASREHVRWAPALGIRNTFLLCSKSQYT
jgi:hypothetical protein